MPDDKLVFFPQGAFICSARAAGVNIYTAPLDTRKYTYVTVSLRVDIPVNNSNAIISFTPRISVDGQAWADTTPSFSSPFSTPYLTVYKITTQAAYMQFKITIMDPITPPPPIGNLDTSLTFTLIGSGHWEEDGEFYEVPIWPPDGILTNVTPMGTKYIYTDPFNTEGYSDLLLAFRADPPIIGGGAALPATGQIELDFQRSNDRINWKTDTSVAFTALTPGGTYPFCEIKKYTELSKWGRCVFSLGNNGMAAVDVGGFISVQGLLKQ